MPYPALIDGFHLDIVPASLAGDGPPAGGPSMVLGADCVAAHVVPGWNAHGRRSTRDDNDASLAALLTEVRAQPWRALEAAVRPWHPTWVERGVLVADVPDAQVRALAERHGQHRVLRWDAEGLRTATYPPGEPAAYDDPVPVAWRPVRRGCPMRRDGVDGACRGDGSLLWEAHRGLLAESLGCGTCGDRPADRDTSGLLVPTAERPWERTPFPVASPRRRPTASLHDAPQEDLEEAPYFVLPGEPAAPLILHAPHAGRQIPEWVRHRILLDHDALEHELDRMTDHATDVIAAYAADRSGAWAFVSRYSRLVVDHERFLEGDEMDAVGMGAVYLATSDGRALRRDDPQHRDELLSEFFQPYANGLADLVDERLAAAGRVVLLDVHSYPADPLPYELHADRARPQVCLGTDPFHTPAWLLAAAQDAFAGWEVGLNEPFAGTYVPLRHLNRDARVASLMVEIRRDCYCTHGRPDLKEVEALGTALGHLAASLIKE